MSTLAEVAMVQGKLVNIGNSRGIRLAKPLLEVAGLADEVEIEAAPGVLTIRPSAHPRAGWAEAAAACDREGLRPMQWAAPVLTTESGHVDKSVC
jgi:antitoxin MazE